MNPPRPTIPPFDNLLRHDAFAGMRKVHQWLVWKLAWDATRSKWTKEPADRRGITAGAGDSRNWSDAARAAVDASRLGPEYGIGFYFSEGCGYWFCDLDHAYRDGEWSQFAKDTVGRYFPGAAVEVSVSNEGLHLFGRGAVPLHGNKCLREGAEFYSHKRFAAMTGSSAQGDCDSDHAVALSWFVPLYFPRSETAGAKPVPDDGPRADYRGPTDDADLIRRAIMSKSAAGVFGGRASFSDLWHNEERALSRAYPADASSSEPYDRSSADAALASHMAWWTGCHAERMESLMRESGLARDKYDRPDYLPRTVANACAIQRDVLQDKPSAAAQATTHGGAPKMTAVVGSTFLGAEEQAKLFAGCVHVVEAHRVLVPGGNLLKPDQFKAKFGGYTFAIDSMASKTTRNAWEAFTESQALRPPRADGTCFRPDLPYGEVVTDAGRARVNTWWPVDVPRIKGDVAPFLDHVAKLLPVKRDAEINLAYLAAIVQHQGVKFPWAIVLQGVEGNGKTLLSRCVHEAVGGRYVHWPKASKLAGNFNAWLVGKVAYLVEDIHVSERVDVIEELKPMIAGGSGLEIEGKGVDQVSSEICGNFVFNTNHAAGLRKTRNDRRFCWLACAQQDVDDLARDGMDGAYMTRLYNWLEHENGYAIVAEFLWTYPIPDDLNPAKGCPRAPFTSSTDAAIEESMSDAEHEILNAIAQGEPGFRGGWVSSHMVETLLASRKLAHGLSRKGRGRFLRTRGYVPHPALDKGQADNVVLPDGKKPVLYVLKGHPAAEAMARADVGRAYTAAQSAT